MRDDGESPRADRVRYEVNRDVQMTTIPIRAFCSVSRSMSFLWSLSDSCCDIVSLDHCAREQQSLSGMQ